MAEQTASVVSIVRDSMEGRGTDIQFDSESDDRLTFTYSGGAVHAHRVPEGFKLVGFGSKWFAIEESD